MIPTIRINTRRNALPPAAIHFPIFSRATTPFWIAAVIPCTDNFEPFPVTWRTAFPLSADACADFLAIWAALAFCIAWRLFSICCFCMDACVFIFSWDRPDTFTTLGAAFTCRLPFSLASAACSGFNLINFFPLSAPCSIASSAAFASSCLLFLSFIFL